jgi:hypothetical protein
MSNVMVIGIDPGRHGAVAGLDASGWFVFVERMPIRIVNGKLAIADGGAILKLIEAHAEQRRVFVCMEAAQPMPKQGTVSTFHYGVQFGSLLATVYDRYRMRLVSPVKWKRAMHLDAIKQKSVDMARQLWPDVVLKRTESDLAEALLLAEYGRVTFQVFGPVSQEDVA